MSNELTIPKSVVLHAIKESAAMTQMIEDARKAIAPFKELGPRIVAVNVAVNSYAIDKWLEAYELLVEAYSILLEVQSAVAPTE